MACKIEIRTTIESSIDKKLPNKEVVMPLEKAKSISEDLNTLWTSAVTRIMPTIPHGFKVIINPLNDAIEKEYKRQVSAEEGFGEEFKEDATEHRRQQELIDNMPKEDKISTPTLFDTPTEEEEDLTREIPNTIQSRRTQANLEKELVDGFLKDFGITTTEYESMKDDLGLDSYTASDLVTKSIAYQKGESILPEVAYFAYSILGKKNNKIRGQLKYLVSNWPKYKERFAYHAQAVKEKEGFITDKREWKDTVRDRVIIDFLKEYLESYYNNPQEFKKSLDTRWIMGIDKFPKDFSVWDKIVKFFEDTLGRFSTKYKAKDEQLKQLGLAIADEVLNQNYEYFNYELGEGQIEKQYQETIDTDPFAKELVKFGQNLGLVLTGSLALRRAGKVFRTVTEAIHDIDWVIPFNLNTNKANKDTFDKLKEIQNKYLEDIKDADESDIKELQLKLTQDTIEEIKNFDWYKKFVEQYPGFVPSGGFFGEGQKDLGSITSQGVIDPERYPSVGYHEEEYTRHSKDPVTKEPITTKEMVKIAHKKGDIIKGTGYAIDFFVRLNDNREEHENYFKLWKEIMIAKLKMGREKDFIDWKAFVPYVKSKDEFNFNYKAYRHLNYESSEGNALEEAPKQLPEKVPTYTEEAYNQIDDSETISSAASAETIAIVKDFLKRIGVNYTGVESIVINGVKQNANAIANITQKLVQVVDGKEANALPEEAMHFAVEILEQTNPALFNKLFKEIHKYDLYQKVLDTYGNNANYQTKEGKPDIRKLKKEAIGKVLAETIIKNNEGSTEKPEIIKQTMTWWDQIMEYFKNLFLKSGFDTVSRQILKGEFKGTAEDIRNSEASIYLQKSKQDDVYDKIKTVSQNVGLKTVKNPEGGEEEKYFVNGKEVKWRVSNLIKTWFDKINADKSLTDSEYQTALNTLRADKGTDGHKDLEHIFDLFIDEHGYKRDNELDDAGYKSLLNPANNDMYDILKENFRNRVATYDKTTRFMREVVVYDPKRPGGDVAGTIDFLAILENGQIDILDWKFKNINTNLYEDIPWYNINSWNRQMNQYRTILQNNYGVKPTDFRQTMMVPIRAIYNMGNPKANVLPQLTDIEIGDVNIKNITDDYLIPVGVEKQKTGDRKIDQLLERLNALYAKLSEQKVLPSERLAKNEQMNALFKAIRHLQMKQDIIPLLEQVKVLNKKVQETIDKYQSVFAGKSKEDFTDVEINNFAKELSIVEDALKSYESLDRELHSLFKGPLSDEDKALKEDVNDTIIDVREHLDNLGEIFTEFTVDFIGGTSQAEKVIKGLGKMFSSTATLQLKGLEALFKKASKTLGFAVMDTQSESARLMDLKNSYETWAASKGLSRKDYFNSIQKKDKNELIDEFNHEFYKELHKKIQLKDFEWIKDNVDVDAYKAYLKEKLAEEYERIENKTRPGTQDKIDRAIADEKEKATRLYDTTSEDSLGWLLYKDISKFPKRATWESVEWKELTKKDSSGNYVNKPALDFYNYIKERNQFYADIGYIANRQARTFLPWIRAGLTEKIIFNGNVGLGEQFLRSISIDEGDVGYGTTDPLTGLPIDKIPKYFTTEFEGAYSRDLFKNISLYNEMAIKFKYLSDIEDQSRALIRLENNKKAIATSVFGRVEREETGEARLTQNNNENSELVQNMVKAIVYQQKYTSSESFDQLLGKLGDMGETLNKKMGIKLFPEGLSMRKISVNKSITQLNNYFQLKTLGLSPLSSFSNYLGGKMNSIINSGKYFTKGDLVSTEMWLLANKMNGSDKQKMMAALDYFIPFVDNYNREATKKLSIKKVSGEDVQDWLMVLMRSGDKAVQTINFFTFLRNAAIVDGKIVNSREYLKTTPKYASFYAGSEEERKSRAAEFENDVKELNENSGVLKLSEVKNGKLVIQGVEQKSDSVIEFRRKVIQFTNDAMGSVSEENKKLVNMSIVGNSVMVFKNWIPRLVDVRFGNLKYNAASDAYEWGRMRVVTQVVAEDALRSLKNLYSIGTGGDAGIEFMRKLYETKKDEYYKNTNKTLEMTEDQFIDMTRQAVRGQAKDALATLALFAAFLGLKANAPDDDDEDPHVKNWYKFLLKATNKVSDELLYFYDVTSIISLTSSGIFPSMGAVTNLYSTITKSLKELYGLVWEDDKWVDDNKVIKYWMRNFPVLNQAAQYLPLFYPDLSKDLGIKMQSTYGIR